MSEYSEKLKDPRWQKKRLEIMQRDGFKCKWCGDGKNTLNIHHYAYSGEPWEVDNNELVTICRHCHLIIETVYTKKVKVDFISWIGNNESIKICLIKLENDDKYDVNKVFYNDIDRSSIFMSTNMILDNSDIDGLFMSINK